MKYIISIILLVMLLFGIRLFNKEFPIKYEETVTRLSKEYKIEKAIIYSMIKVESGYRKDVVSHKGAVGLMQVMPKTAHWILKKNKLKPSKFNLKKAEDNIFIGVLYYDYLRGLYKDDLTKIMAAYNSGQSRVNSGEWKNIEETKNYVIKIRISLWVYRFKLFLRGENGE